LLAAVGFECEFLFHHVPFGIQSDVPDAGRGLFAAPHGGNLAMDLLIGRFHRLSSS
jgi:hypothetical protein